MPALLVVAIVVFLEVVCLGAIWPTLPRYVTETFGGSETAAGLLFACVAAPKLFSNPLWGRASDRSGRKGVLMLLCAATAGGSAMWALSPALGAWVGGGLVWLAASRLIYGVFSAQATLAFAVASDVSTPEKRAGALGVLGAAFGAGLTVGFPAGGWVADAYGYAAVGWLCMACELLAVAIVALALRETRTVEAGARPTRLLGLFGRDAIRWLVAVALLNTVGLSVLTPTLSLYVRDEFGFDPRQAGYAFLVFGVVSVIVQGGLIRPVVKAVGERAAFAGGSMLLAAGFIILALTPPPAAAWPALALIGAGAGFTSPTLAAMFSRSVDPAEQGAAHGLNQSVLSLGRTVAYGFAGAAYAAAVALPYWIGAALLLAAAAPLARLTLARPKTPTTGDD